MSELSGQGKKDWYQRPVVWIGAATLGAAAGLGIAWLDREDTPEHFVDCQTNPNGSVSVIIDAYKESRVAIGSAALPDGGRLSWREKATIIADEGSITTVIKGFGIPTEPVPLDPQFEGLEAELVRNTETGSYITGKIIEVHSEIGSALVQMTYHCSTPGQKA